MKLLSRMWMDGWMDGANAGGLGKVSMAGMRRVGCPL